MKKKKKDINKFQANEVASKLRGMAEKIGGKKYTDESISEIEEKILEERGLLKYVEWIRNGFTKMEKSMKVMMVGMFISVLGILGIVIFDQLGESSSKVTYVFTPNRTILKNTSYLMKITDQKTLDELKAHPSIYRKERLALGSYLEKASTGNLVANTEESLKTKFERLEDYNGTNEVVLGFNFKAEKKTIAKPMLCQFIENENTLKTANESSLIPNKEKNNLTMGACIIKIPNDPMYAVYPKKAFESGAFAFVD